MLGIYKRFRSSLDVFSCVYNYRAIRRWFGGRVSVIKITENEVRFKHSQGSRPNISRNVSSAIPLLRKIIAKSFALLCAHLRSSVVTARPTVEMAEFKGPT